MNTNTIKALAIFAIAIPALTLSRGEVQSGVAKGGYLDPFHPMHVTGPDKGSPTCPVWKYGFEPAVQVWINNDSIENTSNIAKALEKKVTSLGLNKVRAFMVFFNPQGKSPSAFGDSLAKLGDKIGIKNVAFTYLPGPNDGAVSTYQINTSAEVKNTVFVYRDKKVTEKFVNFVATDANLAKLNKAIDHTVAGG